MNNENLNKEELNEQVSNEQTSEKDEVQVTETHADDPKKDEYCGCLSFLIPLWILSGLIGLVINVVQYAEYTDYIADWGIVVFSFGLDIAGIIGLVLLAAKKGFGLILVYVSKIITLFFLLSTQSGYDDEKNIMQVIMALVLLTVLLFVKNKAGVTAFDMLTKKDKALS